MKLLYALPIAVLLAGSGAAMATTAPATSSSGSNAAAATTAPAKTTKDTRTSAHKSSWSTKSSADQKTAAGSQ